MAEVDNISISELRILANFFFDYLEDKMLIQKIELTEDYYWSTLTPEKYNIDQQPEKLGVGQLSEDLNFLKQILKDKDLAVSPNLIHFSAILEFICYNAHFEK